MRIVSCNEVSMEDVYNAFKVGFSDYSIKFEMSMEQFESHFFGPEGNRLLFSFIAYEDELPIGLVLGGCNTYEGILTLRCGTMCVHPDYRRQGIARKLIESHEKLARDLGCKQLFLECISDNDRAVVFYLASDYQVVYQLKYYTHQKHKHVLHDSIQTVSMEDYKIYRSEVEGHVNWQNELWYLEYTKPEFKAVFFHDEIVGMIAYKNNRVCYIHVKKKHRLNGYGKMLLDSVETNGMTKISFTSQGGLQGFMKSTGFVEDEISQIEMYKLL